MQTGGCRKSVGTRRALTLALLLGSTAWAMPVLAQQAESASVDDNTIIVTAQRRAEALEDVPMTVSVISQETLTTSGVNSVRDLANVTTGLQVGNSGSYPQPAIRGITTINAGAYENNVATFVDGLYQYTPQILNMDLPNVQNIQVLKGPQGTLYGRNATGGAILIETIDPGDELQGNLEATYGRFDDKRLKGYIALPMTDRIGLSVAGTMRQTDGYYRKASITTPGAFDGRTLGLNQASVRMKLKAELTENFRATLGYAFTRASDPRGVLFTGIENVNSSYVDNPATPYVDGNATRPRGLGQVAGDFFDLDLRQHEFSLKLELDTGIGTLRSLTGYTKGDLETTFDADGSYTPSGISDSLIRDRTWQENLDFTVNAIDNLDLIIGGNYYNIQTSYDPQRANVSYAAPAGSPPGTPFSSYRKSSEIFFWRTKEAWAAFIDATYHVNDRLSINVGGRYSKETQDVAAQNNNYCTTTGGCAGGVPLGGLTSTSYTRASSAQGSKYKKFTPRVSVRYEIMPNTNVYASYSQGFRSGEWNSVPPAGNVALWFRDGQIGQESVNAYEIGVKHGGGPLRFEVAGFLYDYKDLQISSTRLPESGIGPAIVGLQSVPKARIYGLEASLDYAVTPDFNVRAGATWLHARYGDNAVFIGTGVNPAGVGFNPNSDPLKVVPNVPTIAMDISGMQMSRAPNFTAFVGFDYRIPIGDGGIVFAANVKHSDSYVVTNPSIWGGEALASYQCKKGTLPQSNVACAGIPFVSANYLPNNAARVGGALTADRADDQRARQPAFALLNASVTWTDASDHFYVRVWGNNLTNSIYRTHYNPSTTSTYSPIGEPRTYGGTVGYKF